MQLTFVIFQLELRFLNVVFIWKRIEMLQTAPLARERIEFGNRVGERALSTKQKPEREQRRRCKCDQKIPQPAVFAIPIHGSFIGFLRSRWSSYGNAHALLSGIVSLITRA